MMGCEMVLKARLAVFSLALILTFRMLGLFMILPVFSVAALNLPNTTPILIGLALGIYGLTQALFQLPLGALSDRFGRKSIITLGLLIFIVGSIVAALSKSIDGLIIGRALQGAGAIGSTILASVADLTRDESRSKAMALIGLTIGFAFTLAMIIGPAMNALFGLHGIFWLTAGFAFVGIILNYTTIPESPTFIATAENSSTISAVFKNKELLRLNFGIFTLQAILTSLFIVIPILLTHTLALSSFEQTWLYLIVMVLAFIFALPFIIVAEKNRQLKPIFLGAIATLVFSISLMIFLDAHIFLLGMVLFIFFSAFTLLEASLPSLVSKISPIRNRGSAMGLYSTSQYFGTFIGGSLGGLLFSYYSIPGVLIFCLILAVIWWLIAFAMKQPPYLSTIIIDAHSFTKQNSDKITAFLHKLPGVAEIAMMPNEQLLYVKIDKKIITEHELRKSIEAVTLATLN